jgi:hypothetical protein
VSRGPSFVDDAISSYTISNPEMQVLNLNKYKSSPVPFTKFKGGSMNPELDLSLLFDK